MKNVKNTEVKGLLAQLRTAADGIKAQIHEADSQIADLNEQRRALNNAPVSKADFIAYARADIERRAVSYQQRMKHWARKNNFPFSYAQLERAHILENLQPFPYLDGETPHSGGELDPAALYWHFGELIAERFELALGYFEWPEDVISVADRRLRIAEIDKKLQEVKARRESLANDLIGSGMYE